eukprot:PhM_4_TR2759/c0_g2_i1/m.83631
MQINPVERIAVYVDVDPASMSTPFAIRGGPTKLAVAMRGLNLWHSLKRSTGTQHMFSLHAVKHVAVPPTQQVPVESSDAPAAPTFKQDITVLSSLSSRMTNIDGLAKVMHQGVLEAPEDELGAVQPLDLSGIILNMYQQMSSASGPPWRALIVTGRVAKPSGGLLPELERVLRDSGIPIDIILLHSHRDLVAPERRRNLTSTVDFFMHVADVSGGYMQRACADERHAMRCFTVAVANPAVRQPQASYVSTVATHVYSSSQSEMDDDGADVDRHVFDWGTPKPTIQAVRVPTPLAVSPTRERTVFDSDDDNEAKGAADDIGDGAVQHEVVEFVAEDVVTRAANTPLPHSPPPSSKTSPRATGPSRGWDGNIEVVRMEDLFPDGEKRKGAHRHVDPLTPLASGPHTPTKTLDVPATAPAGKMLSMDEIFGAAEPPQLQMLSPAPPVGNSHDNALDPLGEEAQGSVVIDASNGMVPPSHQHDENEQEVNDDGIVRAHCVEEVEEVEVGSPSLGLGAESVNEDCAHPGKQLKKH